MCELACSSMKEGKFIPSLSRIRVVNNRLEGWSRPVVCLQCEEPMCMAVCPVEAIFKDETPQGDSVVLVDKEKCIGCHQCVVACPFGAIEMVKVANSKKLKASVDPDKCMGCGACVIKCEPEAATLKLVRPEDYIPLMGSL